MKLNVGLITFSPMWEQLLVQEGVPFSYVDCREADTCSVLIVNRRLDHEERILVEAYLASGGAALGYAGHLNGVCGTVRRRERLDYLVGERNGALHEIFLLDLAIVGEVPQEANCLRTSTHLFAAFAGKLGGGYAVILPFDPARMMCDARVVNKSFYSSRERLPSERVSLVSKGELRHLLHEALRLLHHSRNLPYVHAWYFPNGMKNCSTFRVDTDKGSRQEVDQLCHAALDHNVRMTWFVDVKSHEAWLQHFAFLSGQDIGVHCYEHRTYETFDDNYANIAKAKRKLEQEGISVRGFAAPFGAWNRELAKAVSKLGFDFSSEFAYVYDSLPLYPSDGEQTFPTLQIAIHPVCIGSLRRVGYTQEQMQEYFRRVIEEKLARDEPLFFYHHPTHHAWDVVRFIFHYLETRGVESLTMLDFARWWTTRMKYRPTVTYEGERVRVESNAPADDAVWLRVVHPDGREAYVRPAADIDLNALRWNPPREVPPAPSDIRRIREFDPRGLLGELFTTLSRRFKEGTR